MCRIAARLGGRLTVEQVKKLAEGFGGSAEGTLGGTAVSVEVPDGVKNAMAATLTSNGARVAEQQM